MDVVPRPAEATRAHPPPAAFATRSWIALSRSRAPRSKDASLDASSVAFANPSLAPNARAPVSDGSLEEDVHSIDVAEPAAHSVPFPRFDDGPGPPNIIRQPLTVCDGYEAKARHAAGRKWVKTHVEQGMACHVTEGVISANLAQLPRRDPVFVLADGQRALSDALA